MSGGHAHAVDPSRPLDGPIERLPAEVKIVGTAAFAVAVVATPAAMVWPYVVQLAIVGFVAIVALLPLRTVARRLVFEIPFVLLGFAMLLAGGDPSVGVDPLTVSVPGAWSAWTILARSTLGVLAASVLASTTTADELLGGLARLHLPPVVRTIAAFAVRYLVVLRDELERMRLAQALRSGGRRLGAGDVASLGAVLFVRSFERGERVHVAMTARGSGSAATVGLLERSADRRGRGASWPQWAIGLAPALAAASIAALAWRVR